MPYLIFGRHSTGASRVAVTRMLHFFFTIDRYICVKESSVEGTCSVIKRYTNFYRLLQSKNRKVKGSVKSPVKITVNGIW